MTDGPESTGVSLLDIFPRDLARIVAEYTTSAAAYDMFYHLFTMRGSFMAIDINSDWYIIIDRYNPRAWHQRRTHRHTRVRITLCNEWRHYPGRAYPLDVSIVGRISTIWRLIDGLMLGRTSLGASNGYVPGFESLIINELLLANARSQQM